MCALGTFLSATESNLIPAKVVILIGPPGSGKGTQASKLSETLGIPHISTGELFRENIAQGTELGKKAKSYIDAGQLVPDSVVLDMLFERISRPDSYHGYLLDGFPRTIPQAEALDRYLADKRAKVVALDLEVPDEVIIKRLADRLNCKTCGKLYHRYFSPPKQEGVCDQCHSALSQRPDDQPEVVQERLRVYQKQTKPLLDYYRKQGLLEQVDGSRGVDEVFQELVHCLKSKN